MSLDANSDKLLTSLFDSDDISSESIGKLISCIDLTLLDESASLDDIKQVLDQAATNKVAAVCLYLQNYAVLKPLKSTMPLATVINFPDASNTIEQCLKEIDTARELDIDEIDYVFPYASYHAGATKQALEHYQEIASVCSKHQLTLKVILETGAFPDIASVYELCCQLIPFGCNFLKTSTGKITKGASLSMAFAILSAIKDTKSCCGLKVSGGIKTTAQAYAYSLLAESMLDKKITADWFRIGASSLLQNLIQFKKPE